MATVGACQQHAKFRWTEKLTCRFIQLRKEHGKMFTGRKYSAQAGWEYILRQMKEEFPIIMADVHYRVLKKKWSNLLQQYKELKNPVHGDKNRADDISWPFYVAIDEVIGALNLPISQRRRNSTRERDEDENELENDLNPQEFLCLSVTHDDEEEDDVQCVRVPELPRLEPLRQEHRKVSGPVFDVDRDQRTTRRSSKRKSEEAELLSRLPSATELTIRPIRRSNEVIPDSNGSATAATRRETKRNDAELERPRKFGRSESHAVREDASETRVERRIAQFLDYVKKRDEENRNILLRMLAAVEDIRNAVS